MTCCVTGHRPSGFPFPRETDDCKFLEYRSRLIEEAERFIALGYERFITGMSYGADLDFASIILALRWRYDFIKLEAVLPCPVHRSRNFSEHHEQRDYILENADKITVVSDHYFKGCMDKRNRFIVEESDAVLAVWNGRKNGGTWNTINYARKNRKEIRFIELQKLDFFGTEPMRIKLPEL